MIISQLRQAIDNANPHITVEIEVNGNRYDITEVVLVQNLSKEESPIILIRS